MRLGDSARMQAAINITPLVDVVLVLLIIFMVLAPQMRKGPDVNLPNTAKPADQGAENFIELVIDKKKKTVVAKRRWTGTRMDKEPAWAKGYIKVI